MPPDSIPDFFDSLSADYTASIERCFPRYREMLWALLDYLPPSRPYRTILDLGCGTGNLTVLLAEQFPAARIHAVDLSRESLEICRARLSDDPRFSFECQDMGHVEFLPGSFDLVASNIALHHLDSAQKKALFGRACRWLAPGGILSFADQFRGSTEDLYERHLRNWKRLSLEHGATDQEFAMWMEHQRDHDHHDTLSAQMIWLNDVGFHHVDCVWRYLLWSVVQARKP